MDSSEVLFGPDKNLAFFVQKNSLKEVIPVPMKGFCPTHKFIDLNEVLEEKRKHPNALVVVHPECNPEVQEVADFIESTSGMIKRAKKEKAKEFIIATEIGLISRLEREVKGKRFYPASPTAICPNMKKNTLEKVLRSLEKEQFEVKIDSELMKKARKPIKKMFELS
jgi:quinolinate synthase